MPPPEWDPALPRLLTLDECAELAGLHPKTIAKRVRSGELRGTYIGRAVRIHPEDYREWIAGLRGAGQPPAPRMAPPAPQKERRDAGRGAVTRLVVTDGMGR